MLKAMGNELQAVRKLRNLSLQDVAEPAKISVSYLQKLENGSVGSPSPRVLQRLAAALDVPYGRLMELAGYLATGPERAPEPLSLPAVLAREELSEAEWRAVAAFVQYLKALREGTE